MDNFLEDYLSLKTAFRDVKFYSDEHKYRIGDTELQSCTSFISKYKRPFNADFWSKRKAMESGVTQEMIQDLWEKNRMIGTSRGTYVHNTLEDYLKNKIHKVEYSIVESDFTDIEYIDYHSTAQAMAQFGKNFVDSHPHLIPVELEFVVGDAELGIGGTIDFLAFNMEIGKFQIYDWKTDKKFRKINSKAFFKKPLTHLMDTEYNKYSLQMSIYRYIIERNTSIEIDDSFVVWLNPTLNPSYHVEKLKYYKDELVALFERP